MTTRGHHGLLLGGGGGGGGASRYWRMVVLSTTNSPVTDGAASMAEMTYRSIPGGANIATGGVASASNTYPGLSASNAFDGNPSTLWGTASGNGAGSWIKYEFTSPVSVSEVTVTARNDAPNYGVSQTPRSFRIERSDDNSTWTTEWTVSDTGAWANGQTKTFTRP